MQGKSSYLFSLYFLTNILLILIYPYLRFLTNIGFHSLKVFDSFGITYQNSIIYMSLVLMIIAYTRSISNWQFISDGLVIGKVGISCLLFMVKLEYFVGYVCGCLIIWVVIPYPIYRGSNKFIKIRSQQQFYELLKKRVQEKQNKMERYRNCQYRNKMMYFVEFYVDWILTCTFTKQLWYQYSNRYKTNQLQYISINIQKYPQIAKEYNINITGFTKQLPTIILIQNGKQILRFPPVEKNNTVNQVIKYNYQILLRYFDLESRYLETRD